MHRPAAAAGACFYHEVMMIIFVGLFFDLLFEILGSASNLLFKYIIFIMLAGLVFESFYGLVYFRD